MPVWMQYLVPQLLLSRLMGAVALWRWRWFKNKFIMWFVNRYHVDMQEAQQSDPTQFACFHDFFTRPLRAGARIINTQPNTIISPVDGNICEIGKIEAGRLLQAKNHYYSLGALLGGDVELTQKFTQSIFLTAYLAPKDYHRVHMPMAGQLQQMTYVPGRLFSVNPASVTGVPDLFARNERVVCTFQTDIGPMAVIMVGAMIVGSMHTVWHGQVTPACQHQPQCWDYRNKPLQFDKGEEMGFFTLGSTVIVLLPELSAKWLPILQPNQKLRMGQEIGQYYNVVTK